MAHKQGPSKTLTVGAYDGNQLPRMPRDTRGAFIPDAFASARPSYLRPHVQT
jgi:hypothetical protein